MTRSLGLGAPWVAFALSLLTLGACGQVADSPSDDDGAMGGSGTPEGGAGPSGGATSGASGNGAMPNGGVGGTVMTGGASGASATGGSNPTGGAPPGGQGGASGSTPVGGGAGAPGGAPMGGAGAGGMTGGMGGAGAGGASGKGGAGAGGSAGMATCPLVPVGWAAIPGAGHNAPTYGGCDATPVTVTDSSSVAGAICRFTTTCWPTNSSRPDRTSGAKPSSSAEMR